MTISVLIAAYHAAPTIARAIASVQVQTWHTWEIIVVEDGSHDGTEAIVRSLALRSTQIIHYENLGTNQGVAAARNRLLTLATGDVFAFLDADDWWAPDHLALGVRPLAAGPGLVVTGVAPFDLLTGNDLSPVRPPARLTTNPVRTLFDESVIITSSAVLLSRSLAERTGRFDSRLSIGEDRDYWLRAAVAGGRVFIEPALTCHYAKHAGSAMGRTTLVAAQTVRFYEKHAFLDTIPATERRTRLAHSLTTWGRLLRATDPRASAQHLARAWRLTPGNPLILAHWLASSARRLSPSGRRQPPRVDRYLLVTDLLGGQCHYSGIHQLARFFSDEPRVRRLDTADTRLRRRVGKAWSLLHGWPTRNQSQAFTEMQTSWTLTTSPCAVAHFLVGENHAPYLARAHGRARLVATLHMPASVLVAPPPRTGGVDTLVLLTAHNREYFAGAWGARQTVVIPHGVDTDFFHPGPAPLAPSILIVGRFLRDFPLTVSTVLRLAAIHPEWRFEFVVPASVWQGADFAELRRLPTVRWHDRIGDEDLRRLYQQATCHLTPFIDCTANNGLVESLACGLPIVTTDRGGVRDYGAGTIYPLPITDSAAGLATLCERYVSEPAYRAEIADAARTFAVETLAWPVIARRHLALYAQLDAGSASSQEPACRRFRIRIACKQPPTV